MSGAPVAAVMLGAAALLLLLGVAVRLGFNRWIRRLGELRDADGGAHVIRANGSMPEAMPLRGGRLMITFPDPRTAAELVGSYEDQYGIGCVSWTGGSVIVVRCRARWHTRDDFL